MSNNILLLTNNRKVVEKYSKLYKVVECKDLDDVMLKTRDLIHGGAKLLTHPLAGSIKPVQTPIRSIFVEDGVGFDIQSLNMWESAKEKIDMFKKNHIEREYPASIIDDYEEIDLSLADSAHQSLSR